MLSVIIPTLQKDKLVLNKLLENLNRDNSVGEILIIDNSLKGIDIDLEKIKVIKPSENLFVNPSWNLGVKLAKNDYIALFNDDVVIPEGFCSEVYKQLSENKGLFGISEANIKNIFLDELDTELPKSEINILPIQKRNNYYGIIMFMHKSAYHFIPEKIKVWCGDDYLFLKNSENNRQNYIISGQTIMHLRSMSSGCTEFNKIKQNDLKEYSKYNSEYLNHNILKKNTFVQNLFSLRNAGPYKVLTLLAIQFKFKRKANV